MPTFIVQSPPLDDFEHGACAIRLEPWGPPRQPRWVDPYGDVGVVMLQVVGDRVLPTYFGPSRNFKSTASTLTVYEPDGEPCFRVEVRQPR